MIIGLFFWLQNRNTEYGVSMKKVPNGIYNKWYVFVGLLFAGGLFSQDTFSQSRSNDTLGNVSKMDPVVVTATRTETEVSEVSRTVTILTRKEVQQQARFSRNLGDILAKTVPGLGPTSEAVSAFGQTLRGRNYLVLIDGIPQTTALRLNSRDLNSIDVDAIERIEVVRGGTAVYGFGAAGGIVHIFTKKASKEKLAGFSKAGVRFSTEHFDDSVQWETSHRASGTLKQFDYVVAGTYGQRGATFDSSGDRIPPDPLGVQGGLDDTDTYNILGKFGYNFDNNRQRLQVSVNHFSVRQDTNFTFGRGGDPATRTKTPAVRGSFNAFNPGTVNTIVGGDYIHRDLMGSRVTIKGYYSDLSARFAKFPGFAQTEINSEKFGARLTVDTPLKFNDYSFNVIWGVDYLNDEAVQKGLDGPTVVPHMDQDAIAGFAELSLPLSTVGILRAGIRHENLSVDIDDVVNRRGTFVKGGKLDFGETMFNASVVFFLTDYLEMFGSFSQSFSVADIGRAIRDADAAVVSASQLASEAQKVNSYEVGFRGQKGPVQASVVGFYSDSNNGRTFNRDLSIVKQPERIWGVEGAASYRYNEQWNIGGTVTWTDGRVDLDDDGDFEESLPSTRISPVKLTGFLEYSPLHWWDNRIQVMYISDRDVNSTQFGGGKVDDYAVVDLISQFKVGPGRLSIAVKNLINEGYFPLVSQASANALSFARAPGRTVGLTYALDW